MKYSLNLDEDPEVAAVDAVRASAAQLESALVVAVFWEELHPDCKTVRSFSDNERTRMPC